MKYLFEAKSLRIESYKEALENCLREANLLKQLIKVEESEAVSDSEGDILPWIDYIHQEANDDTSR